MPDEQPSADYQGIYALVDRYVSQNTGQHLSDWPDHDEFIQTLRTWRAAALASALDQAVLNLPGHWEQHPWIRANGNRECMTCGDELTAEFRTRA